MRLVHRGRPDAFAVVDERQSGLAYSQAYRMTGTPGAAEVLAQEAFHDVPVVRDGQGFETSSFARALRDAARAVHAAAALHRS